MINIDDIHARKLTTRDIDQLFGMAKQSLTEKGIEGIRDDILLLGLKNGVARPIDAIDVGLFKLNTLVGFAFTELNWLFFEEPTAKLNSIYLIPEFRTEQNYEKLWLHSAHEIKERGIRKIMTTDQWTLVNDCPIFLAWLNGVGKKKQIFEAEL